VTEADSITGIGVPAGRGLRLEFSVGPGLTFAADIVRVGARPRPWARRPSGAGGEDFRPAARAFSSTGLSPLPELTVAWSWPRSVGDGDQPESSTGLDWTGSGPRPAAADSSRGVLARVGVGVFFATSGGVKNPALVPAALIDGLGGLLSSWPPPQGRDPRLALGLGASRLGSPLAGFLLAGDGGLPSGGGCGIWARQSPNTSNPVLPVLPQPFGGGGLDEVLDPTKFKLGRLAVHRLGILLLAPGFPAHAPGAGSIATQLLSHQFGRTFPLVLARAALAGGAAPWRGLCSDSFALGLSLSEHFLPEPAPTQKHCGFVLIAGGEMADRDYARVWFCEGPGCAGRDFANKEGSGGDCSATANPGGPSALRGRALSGGRLPARARAGS